MIAAFIMGETFFFSVIKIHLLYISCRRKNLRRPFVLFLYIQFIILVLQCKKSLINDRHMIKI